MDLDEDKCINNCKIVLRVCVCVGVCVFMSLLNYNIDVYKFNNAGVQSVRYFRHIRYPKEH